MGNLSNHFSTAEFACRHCGRAEVSPALVRELERLRVLARAPIRIVSGYRCPEHNRIVGGAQSSRHLIGSAADITIPGYTMAEVYVLAEQVSAFTRGGIGIYPESGSVHVDVRTAPARWGRFKGHYMLLGDALVAAKRASSAEAKTDG